MFKKRQNRLQEAVMVKAALGVGRRGISPSPYKIFMGKQVGQHREGGGGDICTAGQKYVRDGFSHKDFIVHWPFGQKKGLLKPPGLVRHPEVPKPSEILRPQGFQGSQGFLDPRCSKAPRGSWVSRGSRGPWGFQGL
jgi:hypothetical protein